MELPPLGCPDCDQGRVEEGRKVNRNQDTVIACACVCGGEREKSMLRCTIRAVWCESEGSTHQDTISEYIFT